MRRYQTILSVLLTCVSIVEDADYWRGVMAVAAVKMEVQPVSAIAVLPAKPRRTILVFSSRSCIPCRAQVPELAKLKAVGWIERDWAEDGAAHIWLVGDQFPGAFDHFRVRQTPTLLVLEGGRVVSRFERVLSAGEISRLLNR